MKIFLCLAGTMIFLIQNCSGQVDSAAINLAQFPNKLFAKLNNKNAQLNDALTRQTERYLTRLAKEEKKIYDRLYKLDSNVAKNVFADGQARYASLQAKASNPATTATQLSGEYMPYADSIKSSLAFSQQNPTLINASPRVQQEINASLAQFNKLQSSFKNADEVSEYIRQRKQQLKDQLNKYFKNSPLNKVLDSYNRDVYYYSAQVREYKETLNDPDRLLQEAMVVLNKIPAFTKFIQQNGQLAGLFGIAGNYGSLEGVEGLQTRDQVQQLLNGTLASSGAGGMAAVQNSLSSAHEQLDGLKDKLTSVGKAGEDVNMPDFKPNIQKTKSFLRRLEFGSNLQTTRANGWLPSTTDIGLSIGYKMNKTTIVGIGASYNIGWGSNINHIHFTSQGMGLRTFIDVMIKKNIYISGGAEANYTTKFTSLVQLRSTTMWQKSGLIGLSKIVSLPGKMVKKTKVSLLWNFLSYYELPKTQPILFRVGFIY